MLLIKSKQSMILCKTGGYKTTTRAYHTYRELS